MIRQLYVMLTILVHFSRTSRPNVVLIVADDLGWNDVGFHGSNQILTPNIDILAYSGIILQNYYVLPICTPSRSALMTGLHPIHTGMQTGVLIASEPWGLPLELKLLPEYLKNMGYITHAVGKWHLGHYKSTYTPTKRGFDSHFGYWSGRQDYYDHTAYDDSMWGYDMRRGLNVSWDSLDHYSTDLFTNEAVKLIQEHNESIPMFLYLSHLAVHSANIYQYLQAPQDIINKFSYIEDKDRRIFAAMLWKLDNSVGKVVAALQSKNMLNDTIIIFTTDNGGPAGGFNHNAASNWPLRGVKDTLWEGGVRGSAFIWSNKLPSSKINSNLMHIQDWVPTIMDAVSNSIQNSTNNLDGKSMWSVLMNDSKPPYDQILLNIDPIRNLSGLRKGDWKIISGDAYNGMWNDWYGPSGRNKYSYNITSIYESETAKAFNESNIRLPSVQKVLELRKNATVMCENSTKIKICFMASTLNSVLSFMYITSKRKKKKVDGMQILKYTCNLKTKMCLYDISKDPCELFNRANEYPVILETLESILNSYKQVKPLKCRSDPKSNPKFWNYSWTSWCDYINKINKLV